MTGEARKLGGAILTYGVGEVLTRFVSFLLLPLYTSYLTPADYGVAAILGVVTFLIRPLFSLGFETAMGICYFDARDRPGRDAVVSTTFALLVLACAVMVGVGAALAPQISDVAFGHPRFGRLVVLALCGSAANIVAQPLMQALQFERRARTYVALTTLSAIVSIGLSVLMVVGLRRGITGWMEAEALGRAFTLLVVLVPVLPALTWRISGVISRQLLRLGTPLIPGFAFIFVLQQGNKYVLQWMAGLTTVGLYNIGFNLGVAALGIPVAAFQRAWTPYFMTFLDRRDEARVVFGRTLTYYTFGLGGLAIAVLIVSRPVVMLLTQPAFHDAYLVLGLSALAQFLYGVFYILLPGAYFAKDVRWVTATQGVAALLSVVANVVLIRWLGLVGAGLGLVAGAVAQAAVQHWRNRAAGYLDVRYEWGRIALVGAAFAAYSILTFWPREPILIREIVLSAVAAASLPPLLFLLLKEDERAWAMRRLGTVFRRPARPADA